MALLLNGQFARAVNMHWFAPIFLLGILLVGSAAVLPRPARLSLAERIARLEKRSGFMAWILIGLVFYWGLRLLGLGFTM